MFLPMQYGVIRTEWVKTSLKLSIDSVGNSHEVHLLSSYLFLLQGIASIIQEVMKGFSLAATENLKFEMENFREDMEFKLEKTCLPRPQALGKCPLLLWQTFLGYDTLYPFIPEFISEPQYLK